jgi:hypothetical protein
VLDLAVDKVGEWSGRGIHYFGAMIDLRRQLELVSIKLLCFGARTDVWASGMQCESSLGLQAYLLSSPQPGRKPQFGIFEYAPPETIGTVADQEQYHQNWRGKEALDDPE